MGSWKARVAAGETLTFPVEGRMPEYCVEGAGAGLGVPASLAGTALRLDVGVERALRSSWPLVSKASSRTQRRLSVVKRFTTFTSVAKGEITCRQFAGPLGDLPRSSRESGGGDAATLFGGIGVLIVKLDPFGKISLIGKACLNLPFAPWLCGYKAKIHR